MTLTPGTHLTEKTYSDKLSYGVLVTHKDDYEYMNNAVRDNLLSLETSVESEMNSDQHPRKNQQVHPDHTTFIVGLKWIGGILSCVILFGFVYELYRHRVKRTKKEQIQEYHRTDSSKVLLQMLTCRGKNNHDEIEGTGC